MSLRSIDPSVNYAVNPLHTNMDNLAAQCSPELEDAYRAEQNAVYSLLIKWNNAMEMALLCRNDSINQQLVQLVHKTRAWVVCSRPSTFFPFDVSEKDLQFLALERFIDEHKSTPRIVFERFNITDGMPSRKAPSTSISVLSLLYKCVATLYRYLIKKNEEHLKALAEACKNDENRRKRYAFLQTIHGSSQGNLMRRAIKLIDSSGSGPKQGNAREGQPCHKEDELYLIALRFFKTSPVPLFSNLYVRASVDYAFYGHCGQRERYTDLLKLLCAHFPENYQRKNNRPAPFSTVGITILVIVLIITVMIVLILN